MRSASTGWAWAARCLPAFTAPAIADEWGLSAPFWVAAALVALAGAVP